MRSKIRVVRVFSRLNIGGPSIHVILLTSRLNAADYESLLLVGKEGPREGNMSDLAARCGIHPIEIECLGRDISLWNDLRGIYLLWRFIKRLKPEIVHTHTSKAGFSGRLAARMAGVPVIVHTFHGHVFEGYFGPALTKLFILLERFLAKNCDALITISKTLKKQLVEKGIAPAEKIEVIELGLELEEFLAVRGRSHTLRRELGLGDETPLVGIIGRLVPVKDHRTFLSAAALVAETISDARFAIIGDGGMLHSLQDQVQKSGLNERVYFTGWKSSLADVYADLDLVVISSRNEGTPVSLIEGAASCKPLVATSVGGIPDMITDGWDGILVPPADSSALAQAILRVLGNPDLSRQMGSRARERVRNRYAADRLLTDIEQLYSRLLQKKGLYL
jgi:glycosyltransferase involved in cell wall biosynthesis